MMGFFSYGIPGALLMVAALVHFLRRRPDSYWLWIILLLGPLGSLIYLASEALPELRDPQTFKFVGRARRLRDAELAVVQNPSAGNYEELGQVYFDKGQWDKARDCFDYSIAQRADSIDPFYRRALTELELGDLPSAREDLERVVKADAGYDLQRAAGLLAWVYAQTGRTEEAKKLFQAVVATSTLTETQYHYAEFLASQGYNVEARGWAERILSKRAVMPGFQRQRESFWFRQARSLLTQLPK